MILSSEFNIAITAKNSKHYTKKGFDCNVGDNIVVDWKNVPSYYDIACKCDNCNIEYQVKQHILKIKKHPGLCKSCSSYTGHAPNFIDLTGQTFGRLTIISLNSDIPGKDKTWDALCACGNTKVVSGRSVKSKKTTSCGCYHAEQVALIRTPKVIEKNKQRTGENHPLWDPTKSNQERYRIRTHKMVQFRKETFERDNYTCQCCLTRGSQTLNAHHIIPFSKWVEGRYDLNNLITLCLECHKTYHSMYKQNINENTLNQFKKYKSFV
jgi:5-methylcytosine-specific restriction endonuclease McrA